MTGKKKPPSGLGRAAGDGLAVGDDNDQEKYTPSPTEIQALVNDLRRAVETAKASGNHAAYCEARRAFLLAQAAAYFRTPTLKAAV